MVTIPDATNKIPMMYRAQTPGRCQLHYIDKNLDKQDVEQWASEWIEKTYPDRPQFGGEVRSRTFALSWRFVTNGGQDDGIIRPAIGAFGWPYYPGSSMKGIFRSACKTEEAERYCGGDDGSGDCFPGILRFHGGYPTSESWQENLVDIVHPQQDWQVMSDDKSSGAFALISLVAPELEFGISSTENLEESEWEKIWEIWEKALSRGIGCRVSAGYGRASNADGGVIYSCQLKGQGMAPRLLDGSAEFRPNTFKATIRGHALRIFGGLTDARTAMRLVEELFGGVEGDGGVVGLLGMKFETESLTIGSFGRGAYKVSTYEVEGTLSWLSSKKLPKERKELLKKLIRALTRFAMVFGGFGKSWRRADHRKFFPEYYEGEDNKALIGCHWEWNSDRSLLNDVRVRKLEKVGEFIDAVREEAIAWMEDSGVAPNPGNCADWREAWHPERVLVWGRVANDPEDSAVIPWLHGAYRAAILRGDRERSIYKSRVTGFVGRETRVGRLWHRMYPVVLLKKNPEEPKKPIPKKIPKFLELVTLFPDGSAEFEDFLDFLEEDQNRLRLLWGN